MELYEIIKRQKLTIEKVESGYYDGGIKCYNISKDDKLGDLRREDYPFLYKSIEK